MRLISAFLMLIVFYHVLHTMLVYGMGAVGGFYVAAAKDILRIGVVVMVFLGSWKQLFSVLKNNSTLLRVVVGLSIFSVGMSLAQGVDMMTMIVGIKYDIRPVIVLCMAYLCGQLLATKNKEIVIVEQREKRAKTAILVILVGGVARQIDKVLYPQIFTIFGYGEIGDYVLGGNPPIWYRTGPGGMMRFQGIFAGPNNYGYFLVGFFSTIIMGAWNDLGKRGDRYIYLGIILLLLVSVVATISRGAIVGVGVQIIILVWYMFPRYKKILYRLIGAGVVGVGVLSVMKWGSTIAHFTAWGEGLQAFIQQPLGYGLGSSGPSVHYEGVYLPENQYLQILLDIGLVGFGLWIAAFWLIIKQGVLLFFKKKHGLLDLYCIMLMLGFVGLLVEGLFLHVLEDSMVVYLFFVSLGILLGVRKHLDQQL